VLGAHLMTDGSMSKHVLVPASGTVQFPTDEAVAKGLFYVDLLEPEAMKERLKDGDLMIIVGVGIGYVWGAACVRWGTWTHAVRNTH